jgi:hypothetical protein
MAAHKRADEEANKKQDKLKDIKELHEKKSKIELPQTVRIECNFRY